MQQELSQDEILDQSILTWRSESLLRGPQPNDDLQMWIWVVLGIWLPNRSICDGHCSQLTFFQDVYLEQSLDVILWAARLWGKSFLAGMLCWLKARYNSLWEANICAGSAAQAGRVYKATDLFWRATDNIQGRAILRKEPLKTYTQFLNGSIFEITTSSTKSQRGPHPNYLIADEIDEMDVDVMNSAMDQTIDQHGHKATNILMSTMHKPGGLMGHWVDNAEIRGYELYISCILEAMESCLDYRCDECNLDEYCGRRLKPVCEEEYSRQVELGVIEANQQPLMGHNSVENIQRKVRQGFETDETTGTVKPIDVAAELFCRRPSRTGLVFPNFRETFHVVPAQEIKIQTEWPKGSTTDFGWTDPFVELRFAITPRNQIIFYYEFVETGMTLDAIAAHLKSGMAHTKFRRRFGDPSGATEIDTLKKRGIPIEAVVSEIVEGLDYMHHLFSMNIDGMPAVIISNECRILISELKSLSYPDKGDREKPVKKNDHCVEAARRGIVAWMRGLLQPLNNILKEVYTGGRHRGKETTPETEFFEIKAEVQSVKRGGRSRHSSEREPNQRTKDFI